MTRKPRARGNSQRLWESGLLGGLALRLAQGVRQLEGQLLYARWQDRRSLWRVRTAERWLGHGAELTQTTFVPNIQAAAAIAAQAIKLPAISPPSCAAPGAGRRRCRQAPSSAVAERLDGADKAVRRNQARGL